LSSKWKRIICEVQHSRNYREFVFHETEASAKEATSQPHVSTRPSIACRLVTPGRTYVSVAAISAAAPASPETQAPKDQIGKASDPAPETRVTDGDVFIVMTTVQQITSAQKTVREGETSIVVTKGVQGLVMRK
jgi:hypothetical protein